MLIGAGILERTARAGERRIYYRLRSGTWDGVPRGAPSLTGADPGGHRAGAVVAGDEADVRLRDVREVYVWLEEQLEQHLQNRRATR